MTDKQKIRDAGRLARREMTQEERTKASVKIAERIAQTEIFEKAKMHINPNSTFWVSDTASRLLFLKEPQYYDASLGKLTAASDNEPHYRLTIAYFYKSNVSW